MHNGRRIGTLTGCEMDTAKGCYELDCRRMSYCIKFSKMQDTPGTASKGMTLEEMQEHEADAIANRTLGIGIQKIMAMQQKH